MNVAGRPGSAEAPKGDGPTAEGAGTEPPPGGGRGLDAASTYAALLRAARRASEEARRHGRGLVVGRDGKVVHLTPDEFEAELERAERAFAETGQVPRAEPERPSPA